MALEHAGRVVEVRIDLREIAQRDHDGAHQERQQREARAVALGVHARAQRVQLGHVHFFHVREVRDAALGVLHALGDAPAHADDGDVLDLVAIEAGHRRPALRLRARARAGRLGVCLQVGVHDAPARPARAHLGQVHAQLPGAAAHGRRSDGFLAGGGDLALRDCRRGPRRERACRPSPRPADTCDAGAGLAAGSRLWPQPAGAAAGTAAGGGGGLRCLRLPFAFHLDADQLRADGHQLADLAAQRDHLAVHR